MSEAEDKINSMGDRELIEHMICGSMIARLEKKDADSVAMASRMEPMLRKCLENMTKLDDTLAKLANRSEDLAIERMSNKRMKDLLVDLAGVLHGNPALYPAPLGDLVARIHKEVGL